MDRPQNLRGAAQRVVGLDLAAAVESFDLGRNAAVEFVFAAEHAAAPFGERPHAAGDDLLALMAPAFVEPLGHEVVVGGRNLVHHHRSQRGPVQQPLGMELIDEPDARHHRGAVGDRKPLADVDAHGREAVFAQHLRRGAPLAPIVHLALADQRQGDVGQLHQIAAGAHAPVLGDERADAAVDELHQQIDHLGMDARTGLQQGAEPGDHRRPDIEVGQRLAGAGRVAADDVVLQVGEVAVIDTPLGHGAEAGVDAVDHLLGRKFAEEFITCGHLAERQLRTVDPCVRKQQLFNAIQFQRLYHSSFS